MRFSSKLFSNKRLKIIRKTDEVSSARRLKGIPDKVLIKFLVSNDESDMPSSQQVRQMAYDLLRYRGYGVEA